MIAVLIPVLGRPAQVSEVYESILASSSQASTVLFLCSPGDDDATVAARETGARVLVVEWEAGHGDWAKKINFGLTETSEPFVLLGATDLRFHPGWDTSALALAKQGFGVVGTNDLGNATVMRGLHSTHPLCARSYVETQGTIDEPAKLLHEGYAHQWVDTELVETAKVRGQWAFARDSYVEHLHFLWGKSKRDATYDKALSTSQEDHRLFNQRRRLWELERKNARRRSHVR